MHSTQLNRLAVGALALIAIAAGSGEPSRRGDDERASRAALTRRADAPAIVALSTASVLERAHDAVAAGYHRPRP